MKKTHIFYIVALLFILILILSYNYFNIQLESFSLSSISLSSSNKETETATTKKNSEDIYKYFKILPEYNKFSNETREAMKKKLKKCQVQHGRMNL